MFKIIQLFTLLIFVFLTLSSLITADMTSLVWTLAIPVIPLLLLVIGFGRWRRICPLAWFSKRFQNTTLFKKKFVSPWIVKNFYLLQFSLLVLAFSARHWLLNYEALSLMLFFALVALMALLTGLFFSGKTWCNYICPVSFVEKVYSISNAHRYHISSACDTCTACKANCPDIDMENSYWKEAKLDQKRYLFYAFPGLVFGFYWYFYLQTGSWDYYFSGTWAHYEGSVFSHIFSQGYFFYPDLPLLVAAPLSMLAAALFSLLVFVILEKLIIPFRTGYSKEPQNIQHFIIVLAAYTAFNIFYTFAGAPSYSQVPVFYDMFRFSVVVLSTLILLRELPREERFYLQERFARKILKKWKGEVPKTNNLKEIYYTYATQEKDHKVHLENYRETVLELLEDGILTIEEHSILDKLRLQLGITDSEHHKVLQQIRNENQNLFQLDEPVSQEKLFQKRSYQKVLKSMLEKSHTLDINQLEHLRSQFNITQEEHERIFHELVQNNEIIQKQIHSKLQQLTVLATAYSCITPDESHEYLFLLFTYKKNFYALLDALAKLLILLYDPKRINDLITALKYPSNVSVETITALCEGLNKQQQDTIITIAQLHVLKPSSSSDKALQEALLDYVCAGFDELIAAALLYAYKKELDCSLLYIDTWIAYSNTMIAEIASAIKEKKVSLTDVEKLSFLHSVPIFSKLSHEDLYELVLESQIVNFKPKETLVTQGERGDALYIITQGSCRVTMIQDGNNEPIATIKQGDLIGEIAVISNVNRIATVTADSAVSALKLSGENFTKILYHNPSMSIDIMRQITKRLLRQ